MLRVKTSRTVEMPNASTRKHNRSSAAETVAGDDDLLAEILLRLPIKSLLQFKFVSKHWLSLVTSSNFTRRRNPKAKPSGLLLRCPSLLLNPEFDFVSLIDDEKPLSPPFRSLAFVNDPSGLRICQSCNGLLLCSSNIGANIDLYYYIYNPTTNRFRSLPDPTRRDFIIVRGAASVYAVNLAFDPSRSPHYKVICVYRCDESPGHLEIEIYSSETGLWRPSGDPFTAEVNFSCGVFWNGAFHWIGSWGADSLYFNLDEERLGIMPMPPIPDCWAEDRRLRYFGPSRDHLHLVEIYGPRTTQFNVYEMERNYSGWFVKYRVDLDGVANAFPEMVLSHLDPSDLHYYRFVILGLVRGGEEDDENSFLVVHIPGKAIRYNFVDKTFRKLYDFAPSRGHMEYPVSKDRLKFGGWFNSFEYVESLANV